MAVTSFDLEKLLHPLTPERFFADHWEQGPLFLERRDGDYFRELMTARDLEKLISSSDMRYPALQLARDGGYLAPEMYTHSVRHGRESFAGVPDLAKISEHYRQGATVALPGIHRTWEPLERLCASLQSRFDHAAHANVYITPGNAAGFTPHYDTHEVFVLQIAGAKRWLLHEPPVELPHRTQVFNPKTYVATRALAQYDLNPGDLLYLPRGYVHSTETFASHSAHITIGVSVYTGVYLVKELLQSCVESKELRRALPPGFASRAELRPLLRQTLLAGIERLHSGCEHEHVIDAFAERVRSSHPKRADPFRVDETVIDSRTRLAAPPPSEYRILEDDTHTILEFDGRRHVFPAAVHSTLRAMGAGPSFRTADLCGSASTDAKLGLSRYLSDIGFLTRIG